MCPFVAKICTISAISGKSPATLRQCIKRKMEAILEIEIVGQMIDPRGQAIVPDGW